MKKCSILVLILAISMGGIVTKPAPAEQPLLRGLIDGLLNIVSSTVLNLLNTVVSLVGGLITTATDALNNLANELIAKISRSVPVDISDLQNILAQLGNVGPTIQKLLNLSNGLAAAKNLTAQLSTLINALNKTASIADSVDPTASSGSNITGLISTIQPLITKVLQIATAKPSLPLNQILGNNVVTLISNVVNQTVTTVTKLIFDYTSTVTNNPLTGVIKDIQSSITAAALQQALESVVTLVESFIEPITTKFTNALASAISTLTDLPNKLQQQLNDQIDQLKQKLNDLIAQLSSASVRQAPLSTVDDIKAKVDEAVNTVTDLVAKIVATLQSLLQKLSDLLSSLGPDNLTQIIDQLQAILNQILAKASANPLSAIQIVTCLYNYVPKSIGIVTEAVGELITCITSFVADIVGLVNEIPDAIKGLAADLSGGITNCATNTDPTILTNCLNDTVSAGITSFTNQINSIQSQLDVNGGVVKKFTDCIGNIVNKATADLQSVLDELQTECAVV